MLSIQVQEGDQKSKVSPCVKNIDESSFITPKHFSSVQRIDQRAYMLGSLRSSDLRCSIKAAAASSVVR